MDSAIVPDSAITAYTNCDKDFFPSVHTLLKLLCTVPTTSCEPERVFSTLKQIKTVFRSTMEQERTECLMLLKIHRDMPVNITDMAKAVLSSKSV